MAQALILTRDQLAAFLPNHEAIKAFEKLFALVDENLPVSDSEIFALIAGIKRPDVDSVRRLVDELMQVQGPRVNLDPLMKRVGDLEQLQPKRTDLTSLIRRIETIEAFLGL